MAISRQASEVLIDRAVRAMRELAVSNGPPPDVVEKVRLAGAMAASRHAASMEPAIERIGPALDVGSLSSVPIGSVSSFEAKLTRPRNLATIAAAAVVILLVSQWVLSKSNGNIAFAQVQEQVDKAKTLQYTITSKQKIKKDTKEADAEALQDAQLEKAGHRVLHYPAEATLVQRFMCLGSDRMREEITANHAKEKEFDEMGIASRHIHITDFNKMKEIFLYPEKKTYSIPLAVSPKDAKSDKESPHVGPTSASHIQARESHPPADLHEIVRIPPESTKKLPEKIIDGKKAVGLYVEKTTDGPHGKTTIKQTYWVDPNTKQLVRFEQDWSGPLVGSRLTDDGKWVEAVEYGEVNFVISDIIYDAPLDPTLFSTDPPKGWTDLKTK